MAPMMTTNSPAKGSARVDLLAKTDELDVEPVQLIEHLEEVARGTGDAITSPYQNHIEAAAAGFLHQLIQSGPAGFRSGDAVGVLDDHFQAALGSHLTQVEELRLGVLVDGRDSHVEGGARHWAHQDNTAI